MAQLETERATSVMRENESEFHTPKMEIARE